MDYYFFTLLYVLCLHEHLSLRAKAIKFVDNIFYCCTQLKLALDLSHAYLGPQKIKNIIFQTLFKRYKVQS